MVKFIIRTRLAACAFLLLPTLALAAGLGKLTVLSNLGQPLKAEIELVSVQKNETDSLSVRLPAAAAFRDANIEFSAALTSIKFNIEQRGEDRHVVVLSSSQPMNEPFLDMLVELNWSAGRLVREYTFLLDPAEYKPPQAQAEVAAPVIPAPAIKPIEIAQPSAAQAGAPGIPSAPSADAAPRMPKVPATYLVKRGDTLAKIANANKAEGVSLQQMLVALFRGNADAFDGNNVNRLRAGKILNIPDRTAVSSVGQADAARIVITHAAEFNEYRRRIAAAITETPERADTRRQSASGKITAKLEEKPSPAAAAKDQLKLSKAEEAGQPGAKRSAQALQEDLISKDKALKEATERIAMLEKNVQDMKKLLELKSQSGAQLQQQAAGAAKGPEPAKAAAKAAEPSKPAEPAKSAEAAKPAEPAKEPAKAVEPAKAAPRPAPKPVTPPPPPPPEPSLLDEILENELALYGGGGFLLLLFAGYGYYAWRRKKTLQTIESSAAGEPSLATDAVFGAAASAKVETGAAEVQGELSRVAAAAPVEEVDPIAEADVYMAYGRDVQAEEILKEALAKDPARHAIRTKLLEIYANRKDAKGFEAVATELHSATGGEGADWAKAVALGAQLDPDNPLYGGEPAAGEAGTDTMVLAGAEAAAAVAAGAPDIPLETSAQPGASPGGLDFDLGLGAPAETGAQPATAPTGEATVDLGFDLDLGGTEKPAEAAPAAAPAVETAILEAPLETPAETPVVPETPVAPEAPASIDFDFELPSLGGAAQPAAPAAETSPAAAPASAGSGGIDFDFNLDLPAAKEPEAPAAPLDLSAISLDLGAPSGASAPDDAHWQEVATKIDLAKAYQEMGDKDGARELLNEVLTEGDTAQQQQAQTMLATLS